MGLWWLTDFDEGLKGFAMRCGETLRGVSWDLLDDFSRVFSWFFFMRALKWAYT